MKLPQEQTVQRDFIKDLQQGPRISPHHAQYFLKPKTGITYILPVELWLVSEVPAICSCLSATQTDDQIEAPIDEIHNHTLAAVHLPTPWGAPNPAALE